MDSIVEKFFRIKPLPIIPPETKVYDIVRMVFENANDEFCEFVLWEKTGWPSFWNIPQDGDTPTECLLKQLIQVKQSAKRSKP